MAKTDMTRDIEKALRYYAPRELGGITVNTFRGRSTAFEVPVECGTNTAGMVDCVRINEYFGDRERTRVCRCHTWKREGVRKIPINCPKGIADSDIPEGVGVILYKTGSLRRKQDATFRSMTEEDQKWMILNVLKRIRRE